MVTALCHDGQDGATIPGSNKQGSAAKAGGHDGIW